MGIYICNDKELTVNNCKRLIEKLMKDEVIFLHTEAIDQEMTQRIIDVISGASYAIGCKISKISDYDYIFLPENVLFKELSRLEVFDT